MFGDLDDLDTLFVSGDLDLDSLLFDVVVASRLLVQAALNALVRMSLAAF